MYSSTVITMKKFIYHFFLICLHKLIRVFVTYDDIFMGWSRLLDRGFTNFAELSNRLHFNSHYDPSVFIHWSVTRLALLFVYVDDIFITGNDLIVPSNISIIFIPPFTYFLGLEVHAIVKGIYVSQEKYTKISLPWLN